MKLLLTLLVLVLTLFLYSSNKGAAYNHISPLDPRKIICSQWAIIKKELFDTPLREEIQHTSLNNFTPANPDEIAITWRASIGQPDQIIYIKDKKTGNQLATIVHNKAIKATSFNLKQKLMAFVNYDKSIDIFDLNKSQLLQTLAYNAEVNCVKFNLDGTQFIVIGDDFQAHICDTKTGKPVHSFQHDSLIKAATFNKEGNLVAVIDFNNTVHIWNLKTKHLLCSLPHSNRISTIQFNLEGTQLLVQEACKLESYADLAFPNTDFTHVAPPTSHLWHLPIPDKYNPTYFAGLTHDQFAWMYHAWQEHIVCKHPIPEAAPHHKLPDEIITRLQVFAAQKSISATK